MEEIQAFSQVRFLLSLPDQYVYMSNTKNVFKKNGVILFLPL